MAAAHSWSARFSQLWNDISHGAQDSLCGSRGVWPGSALDEAQHLIDHGEPAEGVRVLAWVIVERGSVVTPEIVETFAI